MIDLTFPIREHFRWPVELSAKGDQTKGDTFRVTTLKGPVHAFTHIDAARHILADGDTIETLDLDRTVGACDVLDLTDVAADSAIDAGRLAEAAAGLAEPLAPRLLLKTGWSSRTPIDERRFWTASPYVTRDGAQWLQDRQPLSVAFDFPQDRTIRDLLDGGPVPPLDAHVTHALLLAQGVTLIEYLANTMALSASRIHLVALPLKIDGADGAPARVIAYPA